MLRKRHTSIIRAYEHTIKNDDLDQGNDTFVCEFINEIKKNWKTRGFASSNEPWDSLRILQISCAVRIF